MSTDVLQNMWLVLLNLYPAAILFFWIFDQRSWRWLAWVKVALIMPITIFGLAVAWALWITKTPNLPLASYTIPYAFFVFFTAKLSCRGMSDLSARRMGRRLLAPSQQFLGAKLMLWARRSGKVGPMR